MNQRDGKRSAQEILLQIVHFTWLCQSGPVKGRLVFDTQRCQAKAELDRHSEDQVTFLQLLGGTACNCWKLVTYLPTMRNDSRALRLFHQNKVALDMLRHNVVKEGLDLLSFAERMPPELFQITSYVETFDKRSRKN